MNPPSGLDEELSTWCDERIRRQIRILVLPAFLVAGAGITAALYVDYLDEVDQRHDACVQRAETINSLIDTNNRQQDQIDSILDLFPGDSPVLEEARDIATATRADFEADFPPLDEEDC